MKYKIDHIYEVHWVDSSSLRGGPWHDRNDEYLSIHECQTVGYCIKASSESVTLCSSIGGHEISGDMTIPMVAITKTWEII